MTSVSNRNPADSGRTSRSLSPTLEKPADAIAAGHKPRVRPLTERLASLLKQQQVIAFYKQQVVEAAEMIQYRRLTALCEDEDDAVEQNKEQKIGHLVEDLEI